MESVHQRVTIYATIIQSVFEKGKGRMVGSLMDSLGSRGRLVSESYHLNGSFRGMHNG